MPQAGPCRGAQDMRAPTVLIAPTRGLFDLDLKAVWEYRELLYFLIWRDVKVRYKQTVIGVAWAVLQPLLTMVVFTVFFGCLARIPSDGLPYPLFAYTALAAVDLFRQALTRSGEQPGRQREPDHARSTFPRLIMPLVVRRGARGRSPAVLRDPRSA